MTNKIMRSATAALLSSSLLIGNSVSAQTVMFRYNPDPLKVARLAVSPINIPDLYIGEPVNVSVSGGGGVGSVTWRSEGELPAGLNFSTSGTLSGNSSASGAYPVTFIAKDSVGDEATYGPVTIQVYDHITTASLFDVLNVDKTDAKAISVSGGKAPIRFSTVSGSLPTGMGFSDSQISGTPSEVGTFPSVVEARDANGRTSNFDVELKVFDELTAAASFNDAYVGESYSGEFTARGGSGIYSWTLDGTFPDGVNFDNGLVSGSFSTTGHYSFSGRVSDGYDFKSALGSITSYDLPQLSSKAYEDAYVGTAYGNGSAPSVSGGKRPLTWSASTMPAGLEINPSTGEITGTPTIDGSTTVTLAARDANGRVAEESVTFDVHAALALAAKNYADPYVGSPYSAVNGSAPTATGGKAPLVWSATGLPSGMTIASSTGVVSGTPTSATPVTANITVTDANTKSVSRSYAFSPRGALALGDKAYADPYVGTAYSAADGAAPTAAGGLAPHRWSATGLPSGLSINPSTGLISGTPTNGSAVTATITLTDANDTSISKNYAFSTRDALVAGNNLPSVVNTTTPVNVAMTATGGKAGYRYAASGLPGGLSLNENSGALTGTPNAVGSFNATVTVTDANGKTTSVSRTIVSSVGALVRNMPASGSPTNLASLFSAAEWNSAVIDKVVNLPAGSVVGSRTASPVVSIGGRWAGTLTFNVQGEIQGFGGAANGGAGGHAFNAETNGQSGQRLNLNVTGAIRGGGGGGGYGGGGGVGGPGSYSYSVREPASGYTYSRPATSWALDDGNNFIFWNGARVAAANHNGTPVSAGGYTYYRGNLRDTRNNRESSSSWYEIYRTGTGSQITSGGASGGGGGGGQGQGYGQGNTGGAGGGGGQPGGQNAGWGGNGGNGGTGGTWGNRGGNGATGAVGNAGNAGGGTAGYGGQAGGASGYAVIGIGNVNLYGGGPRDGGTL